VVSNKVPEIKLNGIKFFELKIYGLKSISIAEIKNNIHIL
jgi:hypothetical protein